MFLVLPRGSITDSRPVALLRIRRFKKSLTRAPAEAVAIPELYPPGGAGRDRTGDLLNANQALSQLSYSPLNLKSRGRAFAAAPLYQNQSRPVGCRNQGKPVPGYFGRTQVLQVEIRIGLIDQSCLTDCSARQGFSGRRFGVERLSLTRIRCTLKRISLSETPPTFSLRKEVIQPQVLLRLPCYDFTPIMNHTLGRCLPCGSACRLLVQFTFVM